MLPGPMDTNRPDCVRAGEDKAIFPAQVCLCALREPVKLPRPCESVSLNKLALTTLLVIPSEVEESQKKMTKLE